MKSYRVREKLHEELLPHLLLARGVAEGEHDGFLNPDYIADSHDPFLMPDMAAAVERLMAARAGGEHVAVWSDYDCDGIPGGVMLAEFLRACGIAVTHYIPHRHREGYGLNLEGIEELAAAGVSVMITLDLGTGDLEQIAFAKQKGIDTIVTDHHLPHGPLPDALVLNPKRADSLYPFDGLCGAGVAWKLIQAMLERDRSLLPEGQEKWLLDLVGLATLSDMVPLRGENRMLAHFGLTVLRRGRRPGVAALLKLLRISARTLTEDDVTFMVSPRINAASRMDSPQAAARLLAATTEEDGQQYARELNRINDERKGLVAATVKEVNKRLAGMDLSQSPLIVMGSPKWRPGILGLVANKLMEAHGKTVFLWGREGGETIKGSCRAARGINLVELMEGAKEAFTHFGGHAASGGFGVEEEKVHELAAALERSYATSQKMSPQEELVVDRELDLHELSHAHRELRKLSPFGVGFSKPLFIIPRVSVTGSRMFGKAQDHLELTLSRGSERVSGISFFCAPGSFTKSVAPGDTADIVGHVEADWRGGARLRVVDVL